MPRALALLPLLLALPAAAASALAPGAPYHLLVVHADCWAPYFVAADWLFRPSDLLRDSPLRTCVLDSFTKSIGVGITSGAVLVNVLQVRKLLGAGTAEGLSLLSQYNAALSNLLMTVWWVWDGTAPASAWAECVIQTLGSLSVIGVMWWFAPPSAAHRAGFVGVLAATVALLTRGGAAWAAALSALLGVRIGKDALSLALFLASNATFWGSRLGQLYTTWAAGGDESQFIVSLVANAVGSGMRVFTGRQEMMTPGKVPKVPREVLPWILYIWVSNCALNGALVAQWWWYGGKAAGGGKGGKRAAAGGARAKSPAKPTPKAARAGTPKASPKPSPAARPPSRAAAISATSSIADLAGSDKKKQAARRR